MTIRRALCRGAVGLLLTTATPAFALQADQIALIVNSNEPAGRELAQLYCRVRHVPDDRILELTLPTGDDISFAEYEKTVVPQVREFLHTGHLENKVTCLVTCYGVPLRIDGRVNTPVDSKELDGIRRDIQTGVADIVPAVTDIEAFARSMTPGFRAGAGNDFDRLMGRADLAVKSIDGVLKSDTDPVKRGEIASQMYAKVSPIVGTRALLQHRALDLKLHPTTRPADTTDLLADQNRFTRDNQLVAELQQQRYDPRARQRLRELVKTRFGGLNYVRLLREQSEYLDPRDTTSAFDNELAMVRVPVYSRVRWQANPYAYMARAAPTGGVLMVARLDGPDPATVKRLIETSLKVETDGLTGKIVVDSRGMVSGRVTASQAPFAGFDQYFRNFAHLVRTKTNLTVVSDDTPASMPAHSADSVAIYTGWYSLRHYTPVCTFNPGAVGFHLASFECVSIHSPSETGWVHGLLSDRVVATLGPVAEPYLMSFPRPDDFFPLLLTGKFTLAEAYWRTVPMTSWMQTLVGDPLYNPYKANPALKSTDLPDRLKAVEPMP